MKNIILYGFMGTGKSIAAKQLALKHGMQYIEMDDEIEKNAGMSINDIFEIHGETHFRFLERELVKKLSHSSGMVVSTGGGVVLNQKNIEDFSRNGICICLWASPEAIYERTRKESHRPLLNVGDSMEKIRELLVKREPLYRKIAYHIDTTSLSPEQVKKKIEEIIKEEGLNAAKTGEGR
jgi:shikimate kinase